MRRALQAQLRAQVVLAHAPRVPQEHLQTLRGDRHATRVRQELRVVPEQLSATMCQRLAALRALLQPLEQKPAPRAHRDNALTQRTQHVNSAQQDATRRRKEAFSVSPVPRADLVV